MKKTLGLILASGLLLVSHPVLANISDLDSENMSVVQSSVNINSSTINVSNDTDGKQVNMTVISLARADLRQPHLLRINATINDRPIKLSKTEIKINGKVVKTIANKSFELNLAPLLANGRNVIEISANSVPTEATIGISLIGPNTQVNNQSSGSGSSKQQIVINVE